MTPSGRKAVFKAAAALKEVTMRDAARSLGSSYDEIVRALLDHRNTGIDKRNGGIALKKRIAKFVGFPVEDVFGVR
jgi:hypothetical protein